ncbi:MULTISPECIES: ATP-binding cassette domain-containing protein [unclassified Helicobacter]|uniref:ATP-binding cassette domain-containing protein n=1 Tax=unclassified Helicobacter TaxID=2593540 RepID=UPI000CF03D45|nr:MULTISPECIES: ATP-binding cassette domain-containing protein [unclassified Helicobacter]
MKQKQDNSFFKNISLILSLITRRDRVVMLGLLFATLILTLIETFGVSIIMPFITLATNPGLILEYKASAAIFNFFHFKNTNQFMITFSILLIGFYIFRAFYNIIYTYSLNRFVSKKYHYFSYGVFCKTIRQDYEKFSKKNLDLIRKNIVQESSNASHFLSSFLNIFSEVSIMLLLYTLLLYISWKMTLVLTFLLLLNILLIAKGVGRAVGKQGAERSKAEGAFFKILSQTLSNFKIVKLRAREEDDFRVFEQISLRRSKVQILFQTFNSLPRNILETVGFCMLVACVGYILYSYGSASAVLPIVSMYALALYRILPSVTKILDHYNMMIFMGKSVEQIYQALQEDDPQEGEDAIEFNDKITLKNIAFSYPAKKEIFIDFNLEIKKGEKVAFVGKSGAGKSTLIDLIIGILKPKGGEIIIDDVKLDNTNIKSWRRKIGYIPQDIYLFDGSVGENIAFGSKIDKARLIEVSKMAKIYDFLQENDGFDTQVGDGGSNLSGGQKQRIGIARALYHNPEILVLDEATSALDTQTESQIMDEIYQISKDKTLLVIAHRLSTIERCDRKITVG